MQFNDVPDYDTLHFTAKSSNIVMNNNKILGNKCNLGQGVM